MKVRAKAVRGQLGESSEKKTPRVEVLFEYGEGAEIWWNGYLTEKTTDRTIQSLRYCGWTGDDLTDLSGINANEVELVIEEETGNDGNVYQVVKWVNQPGGGSKSVMDPSAAKSFAAQMKAKIRAFDAANGVKTPPPKAKPKPVDDADVPF